jgi:integration host factor subunit alpha
MAGKTVARVDLVEAVYQKIGLSRTESAELVGLVLEEISAALAAGENVKLSGFGLFTTRNKKERVGRNPRTGVEAPIKPRRSITFNASPVLKAQVNGGKQKPRPG